MKKSELVTAILCALMFTWLAWQVIPDLKLNQAQPISSTIASVAGVLFGFVLASLSILVSASDNKLIRNTKKTSYFPKLLYRLQLTMACLLLVCVTFIAIMFVPQSVALPKVDVSLLAALLAFGIFSFSFSIILFLFVWKEFSSFSKNL